MISQVGRNELPELEDVLPLLAAPPELSCLNSWRSITSKQSVYSRTSAGIWASAARSTCEE